MQLGDKHRDSVQRGKHRIMMCNGRWRAVLAQDTAVAGRAGTLGFSTTLFGRMYEECSMCKHAGCIAVAQA